jgi:hypothetical protein
MTLDVALLEKLAKWRPDSARDVLDVQAPEAGWAAAVNAECVDSVGCRLWELTIRRTGAALPIDLGARAAQVAGRVTGLLEPLRLLEVDTGRGTALLRSEQPGRRGDDLYYYELRLQADGGSNVRRFRASHESGRREQIDFALTHEVVGKLVSDLTA